MAVLEVQRGASFTNELRFYQDADQTVPADVSYVTGATFSATGVEWPLTLGRGLDLIDDDDHNGISVTLGPDDTASMTLGVYPFSLKLLYPDGTVLFPLDGSLEVTDP